MKRFPVKHFRFQSSKKVFHTTVVQTIAFSGHTLLYINQETNLNLANYIIMLATKQNAKEHIALLLDSLFEANQKAQQEESRLEKVASSRVIFTPQELNKMPQKFRKIFKTNKVYAHIRRRSTISQILAIKNYNFQNFHKKSGPFAIFLYLLIVEGNSAKVNAFRFPDGEIDQIFQKGEL